LHMCVAIARILPPFCADAMYLHASNSNSSLLPEISAT